MEGPLRSVPLPGLVIYFTDQLGLSFNPGGATAALGASPSRPDYHHTKIQVLQWTVGLVFGD